MQVLMLCVCNAGKRLVECNVNASYAVSSFFETCDESRVMAHCFRYENRRCGSTAALYESKAL